MNSKQLWLYFAFLSVAIACRPVTEIETGQVPTLLSWTKQVKVIQYRYGKAKI